jgi:hypothetical protein
MNRGGFGQKQGVATILREAYKRESDVKGIIDGYADMLDSLDMMTLRKLS